MTVDARTLRLRAAVLVGAAAVSLVGCVADEPRSTPSAPATSEAPDEPTDEELLAEAQEVYEGYLAEAGAMYQESDDDYTRLEEWATDEMASKEAAGISDFIDDGISVTSWYSLVSFTDSTLLRARGVVSLEACVDVSTVVLVDASGTDVTPPDRADRVPLLLRFEPSPSGDLLLDAQEPWDETEPSPCV